MKIEFAAEVACSPAALFPWLAEPEKAMRWQKGVKKGEIINATPQKVGTTFREEMEEDGGRLEMLGEITEYVPNRWIAFHLESKIHKLDVRYTVEKLGGKSRLIVESEVTWKFPMSVVSLFIGRRIKAGILRQFESEVGELRKLCETGLDAN